MAVENPDDDEEGFKQQGNKIKLTAYKNGFQIDDGVFRPLTDPVNQKFMDEVNKGYIPQELVDKGYKNLGIALEDKKKEDYKEPVVEKKFEAFLGQGQNLSNIQSQGLDINKNAEFYVDKEKPSCKINIRLHNGEVITQDFNLDQTLDDIVAYVSCVAPVNGTFQLVEGFPPKPLTEFDKNIEQLKLQGSIITQRLV